MNIIMKSISILLFIIFFYQFIIIFKVIANHANIEHEETRRPDLMPDYLKLRQKCQWKKTKKQPWDQCDGDRIECKLPFATSQGTGYFIITRYGPYVSTGNYQQILCIGTGHSPPKGSWLVMGIVGAINPYNEEFFEFPPIHIHHIIPKINSYNPFIPTSISSEYNFLDFWHQSDTTFLFPASAADSQCLLQYGGIQCFLRSYPSGYGKRAYQSDTSSQYIFHVQDVRIKNSKKLSFMLEFGQGFITKILPKQSPLKPVFDMTLGIFSNKIPFTYKLKYNTSMYNFVTYYFPMKCQLIGSGVHWHTIEGDEGWILRGTQRDLGIPEDLQRKPIFGSYETSIGKPIEVNNLELLKKQMKLNLLNAEKKFLIKNHGIKNISLIRSGLKNPFLITKDHFEYLHYNHTNNKKNNNDNNNNDDDDTLSPHLPKLLCIYYGKTEYLSKDDINKKMKNEILKEKVLFSGISNITTIKNPPHLGKSLPIELINYEDEMKAIYDGVQPGYYYRSATNSKIYDDKRYPHCHNFEVEPGEFLTFIHFMKPRIKPLPGYFDSTELTMNMHSTFVTHVHIPQFPYL